MNIKTIVSFDSKIVRMCALDEERLTNTSKKYAGRKIILLAYVIREVLGVLTTEYGKSQEEANKSLYIVLKKLNIRREEIEEKTPQIDYEHGNHIHKQYNKKHKINLEDCIILAGMRRKKVTTVVSGDFNFRAVAKKLGFKKVLGV